MNFKVNTPVSVMSLYDAHFCQLKPLKVWWNGKVYDILQIGLHHTYRLGKTLYHVFSVASRNLFFRLTFNSENLSWHLEEVADGVAN